VGGGPDHRQQVQAVEPATPGRDGGRKQEGSGLAVLHMYQLKTDRPVLEMDGAVSTFVDALGCAHSILCFLPTTDVGRCVLEPVGEEMHSRWPAEAVTYIR